jgi:hypothetical protein
MKSTSWFVAALCCILTLSVCSAASAANIAWVSFHPGDSTPSTNAGTFLFTQAPDVGYTQALTAAGHNVTRVVTQDVPLDAAKLAVLAASDLIIVGRSVASAHYQQAPEHLFWNTTTTKPVIHMGGFAIRGGTGGGSRLGLYTNETLVDSANPIKLIATNPSHPIFAGVSLDGMNTMVNNYATIPSLPHAPNTLQRGISVGTPIAVGGQILGTVAAGDATAGGTVIALFPPGTTMASNPTSVSAGHKLIFLSGSREAANQMIPAPGPTGTNAETSGIYDLTDDGTRMFLNAVNFMLAVPEPNTAMLLLFAVGGLGMLRKR